MSTYENQKEFDRMYLAWEQYIKEGVINHEVVRPVIARSWLRSRGYGIDPFDEKILTISDTKEISKRLSSSSALVKAAHPLMIAAYKMVSGSKFRVDLTDAEGYFLFSVGQDEVFRKTSKLNPMTGVCRSESWIGTCGIALALVENEPIQIYSAEHYNCHLHEWTCSSVPIHSPTGEILGVLNISGHYSLIHRHTLGMAVGMARAIELSLGNTQTIDNLRDYQKVTDLIIKEVCDGLVVFDRERKVLQSNQKGLEIFLSLRKKGGNELTNILQNDEEITDKEITAVINRRKKSFYMTKRTISEENRGGIRECLVFKDLENVHKIAQRIHGKQAFYTFADIIGEHEAIRNAVQEANIAAKEDCPVLLIGETGTGKEMFAQAIHNTSSRRGGPFIAINCGAVPADLIESELFGYEAGAFTGAREGGKPGKIEMADGGSLFLDELDSMPLSMQTKLLRVLQTKQVSRIGGYNDIPVDIRLISASKKDLFAEVEKGVFRDDLFFRVNIVTIHIPPLRNWQSDIPLLCDHFLKRLIARDFKQIKGISSETMDIFMGYSWPGNVRELEGCIERAYIFEERPYITPKSIPSYIHKQKEVFSDGEATTEVATLEDMELRVIQRTLRNYNGNISQAARSLGIARDSLYRKIRKFGLRN
jgi:transcriptional regulator of acetoin/glycerol metabolism